MEKQIQYFGKTASGISCQTLFGSYGVFEKVAGAPPFVNWETGEHLRKYISSISSEDRKKSIYVLVNALGAGEFFGSNINADYFPWDALSHKGQDHGHETFLTAHAFQHHKNKDPTRAFGTPVLSVLNPKMKRVELIIRLDREKAKTEGADGIVSRIEGGEFPDVSMGCKVPFDVCSVCGKHSKTRFDYCEHMHPSEDKRHLYGPNKILPDGRKIFVFNTLPKFFDISFVFIGADKTAKVMAKVASKGNQICLGDVCTIPRPSAEIADIVRTQNLSQGSLSKVASETHDCGCGGDCCLEDQKDLSTSGARNTMKVANTKLSEIIKKIPSNDISSTVLPSQEPEIPPRALDTMAENVSLKNIASTTSRMGIILKPEEFQRILLIKIGMRRLADDLDKNNLVFTHCPVIDRSLQWDDSDFNPELADGLKNLIEKRSAFGLPFAKRMMESKTASICIEREQVSIGPETTTLSDISGLYNGYRDYFNHHLSDSVEFIKTNSILREALIGNSVINMFSKTASANIVSLDTVAYMIGAYYGEKSFINDPFLQNIPWIDTLIYNSA